MPRALKTFVTNLGFYEMAIAAPSMKAALEAWGMGQNAFAHGFAKQTDDAAIIEAAMAVPGVVLKRPVGSRGAFKQNPDKPTSLPASKPAPVKASPKKNTKPKQSPKKSTNAQILSFEKAQERRVAQRKREEEREVAVREREDRKRELAKGKLQDELEEARQQYEAELKLIHAEIENLEERERAQKEKWQKKKSQIEDAMRELK